MLMLRREDGFGVLPVIVVVVVLIIIGLVASKVLTNNKPRQQSQSTRQANSPQTNNENCNSQPRFQTPVDLSKVSSILYPGQYRGNEYKAHGGFRFDSYKPADIVVKAPLDAQIERAGRYIQNGDVQILLEFSAACGITYRFDHILTVAAELQSLVDSLPRPTSDSHTTLVNPPVNITVGQVIATAVGSPSTHNTFVDFGVYNTLHKNKASNDPAWLAKHTQNPNDQYGICWFDLLTPRDATLVRSLPSGSSESGKTSDYCN